MNDMTRTFAELFARVARAEKLLTPAARRMLSNHLARANGPEGMREVLDRWAIGE